MQYSTVLLGFFAKAVNTVYYVILQLYQYCTDMKRQIGKLNFLSSNRHHHTCGLKNNDALLFAILHSFNLLKTLITPHFGNLSIMHRSYLLSSNGVRMECS